MKNGYVKLIFRFSLILAAVLLVSRVSKNDTSALAGEYAGIISSDTPLGGFTEAVRAVNAQKAEPVPADKNVPGSIADLAMTGEGCDSNGEVYVPEDDLPAGHPGSDAVPADAAVTDVAAGDNTPADGTPDNVPDAQVTDIPAEDTPDNTTDNTDDGRNGEEAVPADDAGSDEPGGTGDEPGNDPADGNVTQVADGGNKTDSTPIEQASVSDTKTPAARQAAMTIRSALTPACPSSSWPCCVR